MLKGKLPSVVVNERHQYINAQKQFVQEQKQKLQEFIDQLGISQESLAKVEPKQVCPYDANHRIPEKAFKQHVEKCRLLRAGCQQDELPSQLLNADFCYEGRKSLKIEIDESLLNKIIWDSCAQNGEVYTGHRSMPVSQVDEAMNLTQSDRLAVYQHVVSESHAAGQVISVDRSDELLTTDWGSLVKKGLLDAQDNQKYASKLEQLAALRDLKRRRQSYRAKNVHITKKSYTEIIREVIVNQMEVLVPAVGKDDVEDSKERIAVDRKRKDREEDGDLYRNRKRSRSRSREKRRRRDYQDIEKEQDREKDRHSKNSVRHRDSPSEHRSNSKTVELIKREPGVDERVGWTNQQEDSVPSVNEESMSTSTPIEAPARSRSNSTSPSSDVEDRHRQKHKKSKHSKKKSKHSKKHSKKHKR